MNVLIKDYCRALCTCVAHAAIYTVVFRLLDGWFAVVVVARALLLAMFSDELFGGFATIEGAH